MGRKEFSPGGLPTAIGSMPQTDPVEACNVVIECLPDIPVWPQLPNRSFLENMYVQYSEGLPGVMVEGERIYIDRSVDLSEQIEKLYSAYIENNVALYAISQEYAPGFYEFVSRRPDSAIAVKGQVTGPISFGLTVTDQDRRPSLYDETLADAIARLMRMKAVWMEKELTKLCANTIIFLDEPYLASLGSAFVSLDNEMVIKLINEVLDGLNGLTGMHCCGNTDWSVLMSTDINILSFDAYNHSGTMALYPDSLSKFVDRGGILAWGIVSNEEDHLDSQSVERVVNDLNASMESLSMKGIAFDTLVKQSMITPACSLALMPAEKARKALEMTARVSSEFRRIHNLAS